MVISNMKLFILHVTSPSMKKLQILYASQFHWVRKSWTLYLGVSFRYLKYKNVRGGILRHLESLVKLSNVAIQWKNQITKHISRISVNISHLKFCLIESALRTLLVIALKDLNPDTLAEKSIILEITKDCKCGGTSKSLRFMLISNNPSKQTRNSQFIKRRTFLKLVETTFRKLILLKTLGFVVY